MNRRFFIKKKTLKLTFLSPSIRVCAKPNEDGFASADIG